jgi:hypothetical protein
MQSDDVASQIRAAFETAVRVLGDPREFFASLPKEGGFEAPAIFAATMLVAEGIVLALLSILRLHAGGFLFSLLLLPIFGGIGLAIGAAILLFLSRALEGDASFESSFRVTAYASAIAPIYAVCSIVPYLPILANAYGLYIAILGVIAINRVPEQKAWTVLGGIAAVLLLLSLSATIAARRVAPRLEQWQQHLEKSADELGKASEAWQKQMNQAAEQLKQKLEQQQKGQGSR